MKILLCSSSTKFIELLFICWYSPYFNQISNTSLRKEDLPSAKFLSNISCKIYLIVMIIFWPLQLLLLNIYYWLQHYMQFFIFSIYCSKYITGPNNKGSKELPSRLPSKACVKSLGESNTWTNYGISSHTPNFD